MKASPADVAGEYAAAVDSYLQGGDAEELLLHAYELGRTGVGSGFGLLDFVTVHREALGLALGRASTAEEATNISQVAMGLLLEALSPFEMASRGFREANEQLISMNQTLEKQVVDRTAALQDTVEHLRQTDRERRRLLQRLVAAQEDERERIASDIHDDTIQKMSAAAMRLDMLEMDLPELGGHELFAKAVDSVHRSIAGLRHLMFELKPYVLERDGLAAALRLQFEEESKFKDAPTYELRDALDHEPSEEFRTVAYRIAQEAIINIRKHAHASRVDVSLEGREGGFLVRIADDGVGLDSSVRPESPRGHLGLTSMRERVEMAGGWLKIEGASGEGTSVEFWLPSTHSSTRMEEG